VRRESVEQTVDGATAVDPICGMTVEIDSAKYKSVVNTETIYFCCLRCKETFDRPQITQIAR
jgi:YHS domain-containing protein